jgi:hypothetical protein
MNGLPREWAHHGDKSDSSPLTFARLLLVSQAWAGMARLSRPQVGMTPDRKWKFWGDRRSRSSRDNGKWGTVTRIQHRSVRVEVTQYVGWTPYCGAQPGRFMRASTPFEAKDDTRRGLGSPVAPLINYPLPHYRDLQHGGTKDVPPRVQDHAEAYLIEGKLLT